MPVPHNEVVVLALLAEGPRYGYEIDAEIKRRGLHRWGRVSFSSIYYLLNKLEEGDLVSFEYQKHGRYPTRKVYSLTPEGRKVMRVSLFELISEYRPQPSPSMVGVSFIHVLPKELALESLEMLVASAENMLETHKKTIRKVRKLYPLPTVRELLHLGEMQMAQLISWIGNLIDILEDYPWDRWEKDLEEAELDDADNGDNPR
ncbi:MAG: winged helix DNA-binding protein [Candidatus Coatesbacteria bacterium]|nr:winged helix DNA-binding protein [Candidatus Coatesbacteria bacterium]